MIHRSTNIFRASAAWLCLVAVLALSACGGSSSSGSKTGAATTGAGRTPTSAAEAEVGGKTLRTSTTKKAPTAAGVAYRKCLEAHGAGLPRLVPGPGGSIAGGRLEPPKGVSRSTYEAAVKACGGAGQTATTKAVRRFVECMKANGVKVPPPGKGKGLLSYFGDLKNPNFGPALKKCGTVFSEATKAQ